MVRYCSILLKLRLHIVWRRIKTEELKPESRKCVQAAVNLGAQTQFQGEAEQM